MAAVEECKADVRADKVVPPPCRQVIQAVCIDCQLSGFTGNVAAILASEQLMRLCDAVISLVGRHIISGGGEVMTVKGDRVVAQWRCNGDTQVAAALRAVDAVTAIQSDASSVEVPEGWQRVSARVGVGVGELCVLRVGGAGDRAQQVTVGDALLQASTAREHASEGDVMVSVKVKDLLTEHYAAQGVPMRSDCFKMVSTSHPRVAGKPAPVITAEAQSHGEPRRCYVGAGAKDGMLSKPCTDVTVLCVDMGFTEDDVRACLHDDRALDKIHEAMAAVEEVIRTCKGKVVTVEASKEGLTVTASFSPSAFSAHEGSAAAGALLASLSVNERLQAMGLKASCGVGRGKVVCGALPQISGLVGNSAALMGMAKRKGGGVLVQSDLIQECAGQFEFTPVEGVDVSGSVVVLQGAKRVASNGAASSAQAPEATGGGAADVTQAGGADCQSHADDACQQGGCKCTDSSPTGSTRASRRHSFFPGGAGTTPRRLDTADMASAKVALAVGKLTKALQDIEGREHPTQARKNRRAVDMEWTYRELVDVLRILDDSARVREFALLTDSMSIRTLVKRIDIRPTDKEWLASVYTRESSDTGPEPEIKRSMARRVSAASMRRLSAAVSPREAYSPRSPRGSMASTSSLRTTSEASSSLAVALLNEPSSCRESLADLPSPSGAWGLGMEDGHQSDSDEFWHLDEEGRLQGPSTARQLTAWYYNGTLLEEVLVKRGKGELLPLSIHMDTLRGHPTDLAFLTDSDALAQRLRVAGDPRKDYTSWEFDVFALDPSDLYPLAWSMLQHFALPDLFDFTPKTFWNFMSAVQHYMDKHANPYHCFYHVVDVAHGCFVLLNSMDGAAVLNELEIFACFIAALCHDLDHSGTNNMYHTNAQTELSLLYNDQSPLENHHAATAFKILRKEDCNILAKMSAPEQKQFRKLVIGMILATDMSYHFKLKDMFDGCVMRSAAKRDAERGVMSAAAASGPPPLASDEDKETFLKTILHTADLSNPAKPWPISRAWSDRVVQEFFAQGDMEKAQGLPISPNMDRDTTDQAELSINFADFIIAPAFVALTALLPKVRECVVHVIHNRAQWEEIRRARMSAVLTGDEEKRKEDVVKWDKRRVAFEKIVGAELMQLKTEAPVMGSGDDVAGKNQQHEQKPPPQALPLPPPPSGASRRRSLRILEELVAASATVMEEEKKAES